MSYPRIYLLSLAPECDKNFFCFSELKALTLRASNIECNGTLYITRCRDVSTISTRDIIKKTQKLIQLARMLLSSGYTILCRYNFTYTSLCINKYYVITHFTNKLMAKVISYFFANQYH